LTYHKCRNFHFLSPTTLSSHKLHSMATTNPLSLSCSSHTVHTPLHFSLPPKPFLFLSHCHSNQYAARSKCLRLTTTCKATQVSVAEESSSSGKNWVPVVPVSALPRGERRVIIQEGETILLLWYKEQIFAIENRSPAEGAYSEGLKNAKLTQVSYLLLTCLD
jgi:hypothetical protein